MPFGRLIAAAAVLLSLHAGAHAHALVSWPRQVGLMSANDFNLTVLSADAKPDFCPHCLNAGGVGTVSAEAPAARWTPYEPTDPAFAPRHDHGMCGDPKGVHAHVPPHGEYAAGVTIATYAAGDFIDMEVLVNAHHNGFFLFFLCSLDACGEDSISRKCFEKGACYKLSRAPHPSCETGWDRYCGPVHDAFPGRWYLPPRNQEDTTVNWLGGRNKKMRYVLPKGLTCDKCVVQWYWATANGCNPPGYANYSFPQKWDNLPGDGGSVGGINKHFAECGSSPTAFPEEFWACSENIVIKPQDQKGARTRQVFHDGEMNIEGPGENGWPENLAAYSDAPTVSSGPSGAPSADAPEPGTSASPEASAKPLMVSASAMPIPEEGENEIMTTEEAMMDSQGELEPRESGMPSVIPYQGKSGSKYNLLAYVSSYDTGKCVQNKNGSSYCQACLDLGHGVSKCMWCHAPESGKEQCFPHIPNDV